MAWPNPGAPSLTPPITHITFLVPIGDLTREELVPDKVRIASLLAGVLGIAFYGGLAFLLWLLLRNGLRTRERKLPEPTEAKPAPAREEVLAAVDAGLSELDDSDADPRRAVIACWVRLEQAAAAAGTPRAPGDTSTDLVGRLLTEHQVSAPVLYPLADVYRLARYATHTVDATMRDQARSALGHLRAELARPAPTGAVR